LKASRAASPAGDFWKQTNTDISLAEAGGHGPLPGQEHHLHAVAGGLEGRAGDLDAQTALVQRLTGVWRPVQAGQLEGFGVGRAGGANKKKSTSDQIHQRARSLVVHSNASAR